MMRENVWLSYGKEELAQLEQLSERYKVFLGKCKTERECTTFFKTAAGEAGYRDLKEIIKRKLPVKTGDKVFAAGMGKTIALFHIGSRPLTEGMNILCAHIDSPRLDLKQVPLYEDSELAFLDTHYYGGIKK